MDAERKIRDWSWIMHDNLYSVMSWKPFSSALSSILPFCYALMLKIRPRSWHHHHKKQNWSELQKNSVPGGIGLGRWQSAVVIMSWTHYSLYQPCRCDGCNLVMDRCITVHCTRTCIDESSQIDYGCHLTIMNFLRAFSSLFVHCNYWLQASVEMETHKLPPRNCKWWWS